MDCAGCTDQKGQNGGEACASPPFIFSRLLKFDDQPCTQRDLRYGDEREEHGEVPVAGLVMEDMHAERAADAAAEQGEQKQRFFRDAARAAAGFGLVYAHERE